MDDENSEKNNTQQEFVSEKQNTEPDYEKLAEDLEQDLEDFFRLRATERAKLENHENDPNISGCCMTGCAACPWGYKLPEKGT